MVHAQDPARSQRAFLVKPTGTTHGARTQAQNRRTRGTTSANLVTGVKSGWSECSPQDSVRCRAPLAQYHQPAHSTGSVQRSTKHPSL